MSLCSGISPLESLSINMIENFPLDPMHMVFLGAMRRLLLMYINGPLKSRLSPQTIRNISSELVKLRPYVPREFARKPRTLDEIKMFKATELRSFLLYYGPLVFRKHLKRAHYYNFLLFHASIFIFCCTELHHLLDYANSLLKTFVSQAEKLFGKTFTSYNIHCILHLSAECKNYGDLMSFSAFPFKSYLGHVKDLVRTGNLPLQQVICER